MFCIVCLMVYYYDVNKIRFFKVVYCMISIVGIFSYNLWIIIFLNVWLINLMMVNLKCI